MIERLQQNRTALGSQAFLTLIANEGNGTATIFEDLWDIIINFEQRFSRFKVDSELSEFNHRAGTTIKISKQFHAMLSACQAMSRETVGLFNPFILPSLQQAGYIGSWPTPKDFTPMLDYRSRGNFTSTNDINLLKDSARIPADSALDFGGIGKGYLLDELSLYLKKNGYNNYWLSLGGDIICSGKDIGNQAWSVGVQSTSDEKKLIANIANVSGGLLAIATSGVIKRNGMHQNISWHHIIDPRFGKPALTDLLTVTVTASDAMHADVYAKCLVILGSKEAKHYIEQHHIKAAYLQTQDEQTIIYDVNEMSTI
jgi:thiamine biosynthesis lipoprotein